MSETRKPARRPRLEEDRPQVAQKALVAFAESGSMKAAARKAGVAESTVKGLLTRNADSFQACKKVLAERALLNAAIAADVAHAKSRGLTPMQAFIASKVASQQAIELLAGQAPAMQVSVQILNNLKP